MKRLSAAINSWTESLTGQHDENEVDGGIDTTMDTTPAAAQAGQIFKLGGTPKVEVCLPTRMVRITCMIEYFVCSHIAMNYI